MMWLHRLTLGLVRVGPPPDVVVSSMFGLSEAIDKFQYKAYLGIAKILWGMDSGILSLIHLINQWRNELAYGGFTNALSVVSSNTIGVRRSVFQLALTVFLLLCVATPIIRSSWVNIRKAVVLAVAIPLVLPLLALSFQDIDRARTDLGATLYNDIFESSHFNLDGGGTGGTGLDRDMCPLQSFTAIEDGYKTYRGVDVAAAYLCATYDDVMNPTGALPAEFSRRYFELSPSQLEEQDEAIRDRELEEAEFGLKRLGFGILLLGFALIETCVSLGFTLTLGVLFITLFIAVIFSFFSMFENFLTGVIHKIAALFLESWVVSSIQALLLAGLLSVAEAGVATRVLGMGILGFLLELLFLIMAFKSLMGAITSFAGNAGSGGVSSFEATRAWRGAASMAGNAARTAGGMVTALPDAGAAYSTARQQGASRSAALGYATQSNGPMAAMGTLATAMGYGGSDFVAGRAQAQLAQKRGFGLTSPIAMQGIRDQTDRTAREHQQAERQQVQEQRYQASEARREAEQPQREADRVYQLQERERREQERTAKESQVVQEAPIRAVGVPQIARAMIGQVAQRSGGDKPATGQDVARALGLPPQAFGRHTAAVSALADTLHKTPIPDGLAQQLLVERGLEGGFRRETWAESMQALTSSGLSESAATARMKTLETQMGAIPTGITPADLEKPLVDATSPPSSAGPPRSYAPLPSEQSAQRRKDRGAGGRSAPPAASPAPPPPPQPSQRSQKRRNKKKKR